MYPFEESSTSPTASNTTTQRRVATALTVVGACGVIAALASPLMIVVEETDVATHRTARAFHGLFAQCLNAPLSTPSFSAAPGDVTTAERALEFKSKCDVFFLPTAVPEGQKNESACLVGRGKPGFTREKQHIILLAANVLGLTALAAAFASLAALILHGLRSVKSPNAAVAALFTSGFAGTASIVLFFVAITPCEKDICAAFQSVNQLSSSIDCWALSPVVYIFAAFVAILGGVCLLRCESGSGSKDPAPTTGKGADDDVTILAVTWVENIKTADHETPTPVYSAL